MPIYEFRCEDCRREFEEVILPTLADPLDDQNPECPSCGSRKVERILSAGSFRPHGIPKGKGGFKPPKCRS
jgi:putative FmdB family regulatory protein